MIGGIEVTRGVLVHQRVDAIVHNVSVGTKANPNRDAVLAAGGPELLAALQSLGVPEVGMAVVTAGYSLPVAHVIHVVAPSWHDGSLQDERLLARCHESIVTEATRYRIRTVAMAPLGPRFPADLAARIGIGSLSRALSVTLAVYRVRIVCPTRELFRVYDAVLNELDD
jgi:O-acetyl-ADP-ribose deacetylase (regulator of RNase III)